MTNFNLIKNRLAFLLIISLFSCTSVAEKARPLAFDDARGFGQYAQGGNTGEIYRVTSLVDTKEPGSLRYGIRLKEPRRIIFDVSGVIKLTSPLKINKGNVSILGQTSPHGIALVGAPFVVSADNVIIQHLRFRLGTYGYAEDALTVRNTNNVIIDHCSISWGVDETASLYNNTNFTLQNSIIANSLNNSIHPKGAHGYGGIWGGRNASFINNIIANHSSRTPRINGHRLSSPYTAEEEYIELVNNLIFNWGNNSAYGGENGRFSLINNFYLPGPDTKAKRMFDMYYSDKQFVPTAYIEGNIYQGKTWDENNLLGVIVRTNSKQKLPATEEPQLFADSVILKHKNSVLSKPIVSAKQALKTILTSQTVGAFQTQTGKFYDSIDQQVYNQIKAVLSGKKIKSGIINHEKEQIVSLAAYQAEFVQ